jgi:hypothetical protein
MKAVSATLYKRWYMLTAVVVVGWIIVAFVLYKQIYVANAMIIRFWWIEDTLRLPVLGVLLAGSALSFFLMRITIYRPLSQLVSFGVFFGFALFLMSRLTSPTNTQHLDRISLNGHSYHLVIASANYQGGNFFGSPVAILLQCDPLNIGCDAIWSNNLTDLMPWEDPYQDMALYHRGNTIIVSTPQTIFYTSEN